VALIQGVLIDLEAESLLKVALKVAARRKASVYFRDLVCSEFSNPTCVTMFSTCVVWREGNDVGLVGIDDGRRADR
jgi:hypothetical protein